jgi:hypothetical protein
MPGQISDGVTATRDSNLVNSKAYCEGATAKAFGALVGTNPHASGSEANAAWAAGFAAGTLGAGGKLGPCNIATPVAVPDAVGSTLDEAIVLLVDAGLVVGIVTPADPSDESDLVASQTPAAAAYAAIGSAVNLVMATAP